MTTKWILSFPTDLLLLKQSHYVAVDVSIHVMYTIREMVLILNLNLKP